MTLWITDGETSEYAFATDGVWAYVDGVRVGPYVMGGRA